MSGHDLQEETLLSSPQSRSYQDMVMHKHTLMASSGK